jgi:hypothetical protein
LADDQAQAERDHLLNGLELHLLAYDTTKPRRCPKNKNDSADDSLGGDAGLNPDGLFNEPGEDEDELLDEPFLDPDDSDAAAEDDRGLIAEGSVPKRRRLDSGVGSASDGSMQPAGESIPSSATVGSGSLAGGDISRATTAGSSPLTLMAMTSASASLPGDGTATESLWKINYGRVSTLLLNVEKVFETPTQCVDWDSRPVVSVDSGEEKIRSVLFEWDRWMDREQMTTRPKEKC